MNNMKIRSGIILLEIKDAFLLVADREARKHCRYVLELNDIGAMIWQSIETGMDEEAVIDCIMDTYDITDRTAVLADIEAFIRKLTEYGYLLAEEHDEV